MNNDWMLAAVLRRKAMVSELYETNPIILLAKPISRLHSTILIHKTTTHKIYFAIKSFLALKFL